jgi:hypothetical protein
MLHLIAPSLGIPFMFRKSVLRYFMRRRENDWTKPRQ